MLRDFEGCRSLEPGSSSVQDRHLVDTISFGACESLLFSLEVELVRAVPLDEVLTEVKRYELALDRLKTLTSLACRVFEWALRAERQDQEQSETAL